MKRLAALILAAAVLSGCRAGEKRSFDLRKTLLCGGDAKELRISDVPGESKVNCIPSAKLCRGGL